jgi:hypothetical protein
MKTNKPLPDYYDWSKDYKKEDRLLIALLWTFGLTIALLAIEFILVFNLPCFK